MIQLVIFDFDDTLIDNRFSDYQGFVIPCQMLKLLNPSLKEIYNLRKEGKLARDIVLKLSKNYEKKFSIEKFLTIRRKFINGTDSNQYFKLKPGTRSLLKFLQHNKINCVICSVRKNRQLIYQYLKKENILDYFEKIYLIDNLNINIKNHNVEKRTLIKTKLIQKIKKDQKLKTKDILFVGNAIEDIKSASNTKVNFIFFKNSYIPNYPKLNLKNINKVTNMKKLKILVKKNIRKL